MTRILSPVKNQPAHDLVMTPKPLARAIVAHFDPRGLCLDPAAGKFAFFEAMERRQDVEHKRTVRWCEVTLKEDFLTHESQYDWIVTNPPWSKFRPFLTHAMGHSQHVVFLATFVHFVTRARLRDIAKYNFGFVEALLLPQPPPPWPSSGFQLVAIHLQRGYTGPMIFSHLTQELKI